MRTIEEIKADIKNCTKKYAKSDLITEALHTITKGINLDRLEQICNAERDSRLMEDKQCYK